MPRPRVHALDPLMDAAEQLAVDAGPAAAAGAGPAARRAAISDAAARGGRSCTGRGSSRGNAIEAVVSAADAPAEFLLRQPISGRFSLTVPRRELLGSSEIPEDIAQVLRRLDQTLAATISTATK
ncbi:hypothetical protein [Nocardia fluminea]|uniref:hypothetical protein n=1 Tax=Nocardia fluminea TaxID=134984 RepID=UPI0036471830